MVAANASRELIDRRDVGERGSRPRDDEHIAHHGGGQQGGVTAQAGDASRQGGGRRRGGRRTRRRRRRQRDGGRQQRVPAAGPTVPDGPFARGSSDRGGGRAADVQEQVPRPGRQPHAGGGPTPDRFLLAVHHVLPDTGAGDHGGKTGAVRVPRRVCHAVRLAGVLFREDRMRVWHERSKVHK